jgi:enoyl-CoA hydratase/carnithine racemase
MADLLVNRQGRVAVLTLNRPEHGNRLTTSLANEVADALEAAERALLAALDIYQADRDP